MAFDEDDIGYWYFSRRRRKKVEGGIKARAARFGESWWSARWLEALPSRSTSRLARGRTYARQGQITEFQVKPGRISGKIQGSADEPYEAHIHLPPLTGERQQRIIDEIKARPLFAAKWINREMPQELEAVFARNDRPLFPSAEDLTRDCSCPDETDPCKHIAAVMYLFSLELERDPFLLLEFRGFDREILLSGFPMNVPIFDEEKEAAPEPLPTAVREFWRTFRAPTSPPSSPPAENALLFKQLGSFPLWRGESNLAETLDLVYSRASEIAKKYLARERS